MSPTDLPDPAADLAEDLYATYRDTDDAHKAAVDLVVRAVNGKWLRDDAFLLRCVERNGDGTVWIDFQLAAELVDRTPASGGEKRMLRLACSIVGHLPEQAGDAWTLIDMFNGLDDQNRELALGAIAYGAGYHRRPGGPHDPADEMRHPG